ncbi:MAG: DUF2284 domain-containing protein [Eubacteriales bacterium]|nr:DUF2284 domain-containing protein [Eubacteriales bacterium]
MDQQKIEEQIAAYPVCEYAFVKVSDLVFLDRVRYICETECPQYAKSWSCPPAVGTVEECRQRCGRYTGGFLFTTVAEVNDIADMKETLATRMEHEEITRRIREIFLAQCDEVQALSTESCAICGSCSYPDAPCRHPDRMFPCIESYGILVTDLAERYGISFSNGGNVVTWFSLLLFR